MKKNTQNSSEKIRGKHYWRSLEEYAKTPEFHSWLDREFPAGAAELQGGEVTRRGFLQFMGASLALAGLGLSGCRRPKMKTLPYSKSPELVVPGKYLQYATAMPRRAGAMPLLAKVVEGRPIKLEGSGISSRHVGGTDALAQASILSLYDTDRSRAFVQDKKKITEEKFFEVLKQVRKNYIGVGGEGLALVMNESTSPTRARLIKKLRAEMPHMICAAHDGFSKELELRSAKICFGQRTTALPRYDKANVILSIGRDFLNGEEDGVQAVRDFSQRRMMKSPESEKMNRLYTIETRFTVTGGASDHRLSVKPSEISALTIGIVDEMIRQGIDSLKESMEGLVMRSQVGDNHQIWIRELVMDMIKNRGKVLVVVDSSQPVYVQVLVHSINQALQALGNTLYLIDPLYDAYSSLENVVEKIESDKVKTLVLLDVNPVYDTPTTLNWASLQKRVPEVIHLGSHFDETARLSKVHAPMSHFLEQWGDAYAVDGTLLSIQPMIEPLWGGLSDIDVISVLLGKPKPQGPELVQETLKNRLGITSDFQNSWKRFLRDGMLIGSSMKHQDRLVYNSQNVFLYLKAAPSLVNSSDEYEISFFRCNKVDDGRYANNGWMQELPDQETKLTWGNALIVGPKTARKLRLKTSKKSDQKRIKNGDVVKVEVEGRNLEVPLFIAPGHAEDCFSIACGYGRKSVGRVGNGVGVNVYSLSSMDSLGGKVMKSFLSGVIVSVTEKKDKLSQTQLHHNMEGRALAREASLEEYRKDPDFVDRLSLDSEVPTIDKPGDASYPTYKPIYPNPYGDPIDKGEHQWGMIVDLSGCTGCNACVVACQSENNIPIVGPDQVSRGREMHWIRIDRYFASPENYHEENGEAPENPSMLMQPVMCQHCENAPCESVCPVNATVHSEEGLNLMTYNRCIGTRYCANNCPYKVRRFNFFDYNKRDVLEKKKVADLEFNNLYAGPLGSENEQAVSKMQKNPNVTVRMRGVMEKCTFCIQRIEEAKIGAKVKAKDSSAVRVATDSFQVACQEVCPAGAITFGNLADSQSKVAKMKGADREYGLLSYLNTRPRVTYMARIRNPNPRIPQSEDVGIILMNQSHHGEESAHIEGDENKGGEKH